MVSNSAKDLAALARVEAVVWEAESKRQSMQATDSVFPAGELKVSDMLVVTRLARESVSPR